MPERVACAHCQTSLELPAMDAGNELACGACHGINLLLRAPNGVAHLSPVSPGGGAPPIPAAGKASFKPSSSTQPGPYASDAFQGQNHGHGYAAHQPPSRSQMPPPNLAWGIVCLIVGCQIAGIVAIIYATQVGGAWDRGDTERAERYSDLARNWSIFGLIGWLILAAVLFFGMILGAPSVVPM